MPDQQQTIEDRLAALELRAAIQDNYLGLMRWAAPFILGVAGLLIGVLLK